jgi:hypothetical protein
MFVGLSGLFLYAANLIIIVISVTSFGSAYIARIFAFTDSSLVKDGDEHEE